MNNGQLNVASVQAVAQLVTQETTVPVATATDGEQQNGGDFAGLLSGIQSLAKEKVLPDYGQAEQLPLDAGGENPAADLLALFHASPQIATASEHDAPKAEDSEKSDTCADAVSLGSETSDITSQMALAAYAQPGRMPEVNITTPLPVGTLQKAATVAEPLPAAPAQPDEKLSTKYFTPPAAEHVQPLPHFTVAETAPENASQPAKSDRMFEVNIPTPLPVDRLQNVATVIDISSFIAAATDKIQVGQTTVESLQTAPLQAPVTFSTKTASVSAQNGQIAPQGTGTAELLAVPAEKAAASITSQSELPASNPAAAAVQEARGTRQLLTPEQQLEKGRTGNEPGVVKEMAPSLQSAVSAGESMLGSDTLQSSDSNQGQPGTASDNQMLEQQMRGQLSTEHQKVAALSAKAAPTETVRQDIPEQVMHQVKERLLQHDVKAGSQQITLTLSPDSLGELKMNLNLQGQKLSVEIVTESRTVRDAIVLHVDALKESLARQNITMESFDVTTGGKGSGSQGQNQNAWRELAKQQQQQQLWASPRGYNTAQADLPSGQAAYQRQQGQSMLDIHY